MNLINKVGRTAFLIFIMWLACLSITAESNEKAVLKTSLDKFPPWMMYRSSGNFEGAEVDVVKAIGKKLNLKIEFKAFPFKRGLKAMETGNIDLLIGVLKRPAREIYIDFIDPPYKKKSNKTFYVLKGNVHLIKTYDDLKDLNVGLRIGARYFPQLDNDSTIKKMLVSSDTQNINKLLSKRIDTFVTTDSLRDYLIKQAGVQHKIEKASYGYFKENNVYIGLSKNSYLIKTRGDKIKDVIHKMIQSGEVVSNY